MGRYEIGTPRGVYNNDCLVCAENIADEIMKRGDKVYIKDNFENKIIYGNYFALS